MAEMARLRGASPEPLVGLPSVRVRRSTLKDEEEEELVPSVPLASEDSDLGESGDFESFSDGEEEAAREGEEEPVEKLERLRTPGHRPEALTIK
jgi:hypothetical protein